jgi:hypothetical protein
VAKFINFLLYQLINLFFADDVVHDELFSAFAGPDHLGVEEIGLDVLVMFEDVVDVYQD